MKCRLLYNENKAGRPRALYFKSATEAENLYNYSIVNRILDKDAAIKTKIISAKTLWKCR